VVQVGLLEHERHAEHALPEVDRRLAVRADDGDVVDALALELAHGSPFYPASWSTSFDLYSLRCRVPQGTSSMRVCTTSTSRSRRRMRSASVSWACAWRASSTRTGSGGSCRGPSASARTRMWPLTAGSNVLTTSRTAGGESFTPRTSRLSSATATDPTR